MRAAFERAWPGNHGKRQRIAEFRRSDGDGRVWFCAHHPISGAHFRARDRTVVILSGSPVLK
jgi:hypothetical protein